MTEIEELQWGIEAMLNGDTGDNVRKKVELLISAVDVEAFARGVAEGKEQMKETIRKAVIEELHDPDWDSDIIPASILSPKEPPCNG